ncbi:hypothetical protein DYE50_04935 [Treponema ruminis]|uniref:37-kD nucleoid-associated bacterial protein n=1 Tax=Treponema ruminis TaxID=744515 RepID=A0A7W8G7L3_9SPIR|nr:hypothetical protein [Treponema ruminis]MBB5225209.1 hypothetical protein [Treponema ruminis]QSI01920.1 hypothetical protein DYE50_04935 [Treponema ruminis]
METIFINLFKIDLNLEQCTKESFTDKYNIQKYLSELLDAIVSSSGDREYEFDETLMTTKNRILSIVKNLDEQIKQNECILLAQKLLVTELDVQKKIQKLNVEIQKGILVIAAAKITDADYKFIITKADYAEFVEEITGNTKSGLPLKKKIFKSFIADIKYANNDYTFQRIVTYDSNINHSVYWWKSFLELKELRDNTTNTKKAFELINNTVLAPLQKDHKTDYIKLWNSTVAYFRTKGEFDITYYAENVIGNYIPYDDSLEMSPLKTKITELQNKNKFDNKFEKDPLSITNRMKKELKLTNEIDLVIKQDIPNLSSIIKPKEEDGKKYIMVLSTDGYEYAKGL